MIHFIQSMYKWGLDRSHIVVLSTAEDYYELNIAFYPHNPKMFHWER